MPGNKYLKHVNGGIAEEAAVQASSGAPDAGKIPALDAAGKLDQTMMPTGIAPDVAVVQASENLAAGDLVNVWNSAGNPRVRKADASTAGKEAHGFVKAAVLSGANATIYFEGSNDQVTGLTAGVQYLSTTPGLSDETPPNGSGNVVQRVGLATGATSLNFESGTPITLA